MGPARGDEGLFWVVLASALSWRYNQLRQKVRRQLRQPRDEDRRQPASRSTERSASTSARDLHCERQRTGVPVEFAQTAGFGAGIGTSVAAIAAIADIEAR